MGHSSWEVDSSVKKFPAFYGTRKFIIIITNAHKIYYHSKWSCWKIFMMIYLYETIYE
jgi:hypothetical protein